MLFSLLLEAVTAIDRSKYRTCAQSKFCERNRFVSPQSWSLQEESTAILDNVAIATINDTNWKNEFRLKVSFLSCGATRIRIEPPDSEPFRFNLSQEPTAINQTVLHSVLPIQLSTNDTHVLRTSGDRSLAVQYRPFLLVASDATGTRMTINPDGTAVFEMRSSEQTHPAFFDDIDFGGHVDEMKRGPSAMAIEVEFHAQDTRLSGLPSHTLPLTLHATVNGSDPIRFFNTDAHRFETGNGMSMYGAVPFLLSRASARSDAVFWCNPSETWVDLTTVRRT
jgi:alpha 1,3-glucosidase